MDTINELLSELERRGIRLRAEGNRIFCVAAPAALTPDLQQEIRRRKPELLALLGSANADRGSPTLLPRSDRTRPAPASFGQERLWLLQQMTPEGFAYNIPGAVRLAGPLDLGALERALTKIVERHEVLRTTLELEGDRLVQIVHPAIPVRLEKRSLSHVLGDARHRAVSEEVTRLAQQPFDLASCPYWRFALLQIGPEEHVLAIVQHHIVSDGWSLGIFMRELGLLYDACVHGREPELPRLALQYGDYAAWQRAWLNGERFDSLLAWWKSQLADLPPALEMPTDHPRPELQTFEGTAELTVLSRADGLAVLEFCQAQGVTPFMTLLAAWAAILSRYSQQRDLVIGTPVGNRSHADLEPLLGFFLNTLALRIDLSDDPSFAELVRQVRHVALEAFERHELPFEKLVEEIRPERDLSRSPVFQVMFIMHNAPKARLELSDLTLGETSFESGTSKYDLTLSASMMGDRLVLALEYNTALFEKTSILRMLGHYRELLVRAMAEPHRPASELPLLTPAQKTRLTVEWNGAAVDYPRGATVCSLIYVQARATPDAIAVRDRHVAWTYAELTAFADRIAARLSSQGVRRGDRVAVLAHRSADMVGMLLGVLLSGAAYVPLDLALPPARQRFILGDADVKLILTQRDLVNEFQDISLPLLCVEERKDRRLGASRRGEPAPNDIAYVMYTSGSTGQPKGVCVAHQAVVNFLAAMQLQPSATKADRVLAVTSPTFDISVLEMFLPLSLGAQVIVADRDDVQDGARLTDLIESEGITLMQATPATWTMLLRSGWDGSPALRALCGGEALTQALADKLLERCCEVWNMYGPTETTVWSSCQRVTRGPRAPSIGRPIANTQIYVLDERLELAPVGVWGELCIAGDGLALGYHGRPGQTAAAFVPNPFALSPGARMYRTGDLARWLPNQQLELRGRLDRQVKLRGYRIELEEIEHALKRDLQVSDAAVKVYGAADAQSLVAWVVPAGAASLTGEELRQRLSQVLPHYMIPSRIEICDVLPLTPSGKVDRKRLPALQPDRPRLHQSFVAPRTKTEAKIATIWQTVLSLDRVGLHDSFFDLGGHSLLLASVREHLRREFAREISMLDLFRHPTVASLAVRLA